eukprot:1838314-Rhodomonas_salina.4
MPLQSKSHEGGSAHVQFVGSSRHGQPMLYMMRLCSSFRVSAPALMPSLPPYRIAKFASDSRSFSSLIAPIRLGLLLPKQNASSTAAAAPSLPGEHPLRSAAASGPVASLCFRRSVLPLTITPFSTWIEARWLRA